MTWTWTYSGDPSTSDLDALRLLIGDTDTNHQLLSNEELTFILTIQTNTYYAASVAADACAAKFAPSTQESLGDISGAYQQRYDHFVQLAKHFRRLAARQATVFFGGVQPTEDEADEHVRRFKRDQMLDTTW